MDIFTPSPLSTQIEAIFPCSPIQQGMLFSQIRASGCYETFSIWEATAIGSTVNTERVCRAWQDVVQRHAALRTIFMENQDGEYIQIVLTTVTPTVEIIETELVDEVKIREMLVALDGISFNPHRLSHKLTICKAPGQKVFCKLEMNHIIIDGSSVAILATDLRRAYDSVLDKTSRPLYSDYISYIQLQNVEDSLGFWVKQLNDVRPCHFPQLADGPDSHEATTPELLSQEVVLDISFDAITSFCSRTGITISNLFQVAWGLVLRAFTGSDQVCFGYLTSGRDAPINDIADIVGPLINMLVCSLNMTESESSIESLLQQVQQDFLDSLPHQHCSLAQIQHALPGASRDLFNTILSLQRSSPPASSDYTLSLGNVIGYDPTEVTIETWNTRMSKSQLASVASTLSQAVNVIVKSSHGSVQGADLFSEHDRNQLIVWDGEEPELVDSCIHELIMARTRATPEAIAVCAWDYGDLSYSKLDELSTKLALHLVALGVGPEVIVPYCLSKSVWAIVTIIGILKAGGACTALDPEYPQSRLESLIKETGARVVLTSPSHSRLFEALVPHVVVVDEAAFEICGTNSPFPVSRVTPKNTAFVVFTSGSTGVPKGVVLEHRGFATSFRAGAIRMGISSTTRSYQFSNFTFDLSIEDIISPLIAGGTVCVPSESDRVNDLAHSIRKLEANWANLTPSVAALLNPEDVPSLRTLVLGGEALRQDIVDKWARHVVLLNGYGPSESSVTCAVSPPIQPGADPKNIGNGTACHLWVVDGNDHHRLAPIGTVGELLIEGPTLARGYLHDALKTASSFIEDPAWVMNFDSKNAPRRMYKTGDLVRYAVDGSIVFVGRKDTQIKLHGQRIELGEIEFHLTSSNAVEEGVIIFPNSGLCKDRLVAVFALCVAEPSARGSGDLSLVLHENKSLAAEKVASIEEELSTRLPRHMVPSVWALVTSLPKLSSTKIDRKTIQLWVTDMSSDIYQQIESLADETTNQEPSTAMEKKFQVICGEILNKPAKGVGLHKSFLQAGGDSISAMAFVARCRKEGIPIDIQNLLRSRSLAETASKSQEVTESKSCADVMTDAPFDLSPMQRMYFSWVPHGFNHYNQSVHLSLTRKVDTSALRDALAQLVRKHAMLRARFINSDGWRQTILWDVENTYRFNVQDAKKLEVPIMIQESQSSLDIVNGPVFSVDLFNIENAEQQLFLVAHHLVVDLLSWDIILRDLEDVLQSGTALAPSLSFQAWCRLQNEYISKQVHPGSASPFTVTPSDPGFWGMQSTANSVGDSQHISFTLAPELTKKLLGEVCHRALRTEPVDIMLSTISHAFLQVFRRSLPAIYIEGHGRESWDAGIDLSSTVGWFTTICPIQTNANESNGLIDILRQIKDVRRRIPQGGRSYFAQRFRDGSEDQRAVMEMKFNYTGLYKQLNHVDSLFQSIQRQNIHDSGKDMPRDSLFDILVAPGGSQTLEFVFTFPRHILHQEKIKLWVEQCELSLKATLHQLEHHESQTTLSDFPLLSLTSYEDLDTLIHDRLSKVGVMDIDDVEDIYPLSAVQQGILLSQIRSPGYYETFTVFEVKASGSVDVQQLATAWQHTVNHHPCLRTVFVESISDSNPYYQAVLKQLSANIQFIECDDRSVPVNIFQQSTIHDDSKTVNIARGEHRVTIYSTVQGRTFVKLEMSHALTDAASGSIILRDFCAAYDHQLLPSTKPLYSSYIAYLQARSLDESLAYWTSRLANAEACFFPTLKNSGDNDLCEIDVEMPVTFACMREYCSKIGIAMSNLFQVAWALVLRAYTGSDHVTFGYLTSGRDVPVEEVEEIVGVFINMLVCSIELTPSGTVQAALETVQTDFIQSLSHQHVSLAQIQHALGAQGSLFNTIMSIQRRASASSNSSLILEEITGSDPTEYGITVHVTIHDDRAVASLAYRSSLLSSAHAINVASAFSHALKSVVDQPPTTYIGGISLFSDHHRQTAISRNTLLPDLLDGCVHDLVMEMVHLQPSSVALRSWDHSDLTYDALNTLSTRLANYLIHLGVRPGTFVPLCFEKSAWAVVAMLAVMKAGGAYVAVAPLHSADRKAHIISATSATLILTGKKQSNMFDDMVGTIFPVTAETVQQLDYVSTKINTKVHSSDPVSLVFTSGTTGTPKGIVVEHGAFVTSSLAHAKVLGMGKNSVVGQFSSFVFDVSMSEIWMTLMHGGTVCMPSEDERMGDLAGFINSNQVNWICLTPTVATILQPESVPTLQTLVLTGERATAHNYQIWSERVKLFNAYGPAECGVWASINAVQSVDTDASCIGMSTDASLLWVVDPRDPSQLVPLGAVGELVIEGPLVSRGYLNDDEKSNSVFLTDPAWTNALNLSVSSTTPGMRRRMYRTGDLVRSNVDGSITLIGRVGGDTQVKLRGQRIELGEIEHQVRSSLPIIRNAIVEQVSVQEDPNIKMLVAFISLADGVETTTEGDRNSILKMSARLKSSFLELATLLAKSLATYMVPSMYIPVGEMPTSLSGKVDRKRLRKLTEGFTPAQVAQYSLAEELKQAPTTDMEKKLQALWADVLHIPISSIGANDHFFRLGANSISAMYLVPMAREAGILLTITNIFQSPQLDELAKLAVFAERQVVKDLEPFTLIKGADAVDDLLVLLESQYHIPKQSVQDAFPTSPLQEALFSLSVRHNGTYVAQNIFKLPPHLDLDRFRQAWQIVADRNSILRSRIVHTSRWGSLSVVLQENLLWKSTSSLEEYLAKDRNVPIEHGKSLSRYAIAGEYFVWTIAHSLYDGWSRFLIMKEVQQVYQGVSLGASPPSFSNFIQYLTETTPDEARNFWVSQLSNDAVSGFLPLPTPSYQPISDGLLKHEMAFTESSQTDFKTSTMIRAAWAIVLARYCNSESVVFGATLTGRNANVPGITDMTGPTITTVPIQATIQPGNSVSQLLGELYDQEISMIPFEHTGLQKIKQFSPACANACEFQSLLVVHVTEYSDPNAQAADSEFWQMADGTAMDTRFLTYPLALECFISAGKVTLELQYDKQMVTEAQVQRILHHFQHVLHQVNSASDDGTLAEVDLFTERDMAEILMWNKLKAPPRDYQKCVHNAVERIVATNPKDLAVSSWDESFTYDELDNFSTRLAQHLQSMGVGPEVLVPVCFSKSAWAVVAQLGILKAGGAVYAIDPSFPITRIAGIIEDARSTILLAGTTHIEYLTGTVPIIVSVGPSLFTSLPPVNRSLVSVVQPHNTAFVVFTSGSTGTPKGILLSHSAICESMRSHGEVFQLGRESRVMQFAAFTFDVSIHDIFTTLTHGGVVCMPSDHERMNDLSGFMNKMAVNHTCLTPTVSMLLSDVPSLKTLALVGEITTPEAIDKWVDRTKLLAMYGPAETSIHAAYHHVTERSNNPTNFGRAIGSIMWIVDPNNHNKLAPIGCVGEVVIQGPILAQGYLNNPDKTSDAFIQSPEWLSAEYCHEGWTTRIYKSGDLARYNSDGTMSFFKRKDTQVKVRGQRVELGDIEHHFLQRAPSSWRVVVDLITPAGHEHDPILAAFFTIQSRDSQGISETVVVQMSDEVQSVLLKVKIGMEEALPSYMLPGTFVLISSIPITLSAKLDRRRLRQLGADLTLNQLTSFSLRDTAQQAPSTNMEKTLQRLWSEVLNLPTNQISAGDHFLRLGGDSITAMRLAGAARTHNINLLVSDIFRTPKLSDMSLAATELIHSKALNSPSFASITEEMQSAIRSQISIYSDMVEDIVEASDYQAWAMAAGHLKQRGYLNYFSFRFDGSIDAVQLEQACHTLVHHHPILRTVFAVYRQKTYQVVLKHIQLEFKHDNCTQEEYDEEFGSGASRDFIAQDMARDVNLGMPLVQFKLLKYGAERHRLVMRISHAQYDGIAVPILIRDLKAAYLKAPLTSAPTFSSFVRHTQITHGSESEAFWRDLLQGSRMTHVLARPTPTYRNPINDSVSMNVHSPSLGTHGLTFATVFKAAWALVLSRLSNNRDVTFGHVISGRNDTSIPQVQNLAGPCLNIVPVRVQFPHTSDWNGMDLLSHIQNQHLSMIPHENYGFRRIIETCTSWPRWERFSSVIQHQNLDDEIEQFSFGNANCSVEWFTPPHDLADLWIWSFPIGYNDYCIQLTYSDNVLSKDVADSLLCALGETVESLSKGLQAKVASLTSDKCSLSLPISLSTDISSSSPCIEVMGQDVNGIVAEVWKTAFGELPGETRSVDTAYYEVWGDPMAPVQISTLFNQHGVNVTVDEVVEHPTMRLQMQLINQKLQN
ncbi:nonribosomal peptide synthase [Penicillium paradoxum]|uniref:nonribosomal peptide synthase n=1 Tax=Penicillium paradoxum TaxID=176176 RepID=UPI00254966CF|nr:nonribosomal peptide synthase [Penicillium paradoxum]KAJ5794578.1 nonribosomal peptide synthase [Penicillium paradoxum]